jgi:Putative phage metallopeptidase
MALKAVEKEDIEKMALEIVKPTKVLREDLQARKFAAEALGWRFNQDADEMWSASKGANFYGKHRYIEALLNQIEGREPGYDSEPKRNGCRSCKKRTQTSDGLCVVCTIDLNKYEAPQFNRMSKDQEFAPAREAADIGKIIVPRFHFHLDNEEVRIEYVFLKKTPVVKGKEILGRAKKVSGLNAWLALPEEMREKQTVPESFFLIEFSWEPWTFMKPWSRVALVDHELKHCQLDDNSKLTLNSHDYEEFVEIYERYGDWRGDFKAFKEAMRERGKMPLLTAIETAKAG